MAAALAQPPLLWPGPSGQRPNSSPDSIFALLRSLPTQPPSEPSSVQVRPRCFSASAFRGPACHSKRTPSHELERPASSPIASTASRCSPPRDTGLLGSFSTTRTRTGTGTRTGTRTASAPAAGAAHAFSWMRRLLQRRLIRGTSPTERTCKHTPHQHTHKHAAHQHTRKHAPHCHPRLPPPPSQTLRSPPVSNRHITFLPDVFVSSPPAIKCKCYKNRVLVFSHGT